METVTITEGDRAALRASIISAEAARALNESGCDCVSLFMPFIAQQLCAVEDDIDQSMRVLGRDEMGNIMMGARGPMTPDDVVRNVRGLHPEWERYFNQQ